MHLFYSHKPLRSSNQKIKPEKTVGLSFSWTAIINYLCMRNTEEIIITVKIKPFIFNLVNGYDIQVN